MLLDGAQLLCAGVQEKTENTGHYYHIRLSMAPGVRHVRAVGQVPLHAVRHGPQGNMVMAGGALGGGLGGQPMQRWAADAPGMRRGAAASPRDLHAQQGAHMQAQGGLRQVRTGGPQMQLALSGGSMSPYRSTMVSDWGLSDGELVQRAQQGQQMPSLMADLLGEQGTPR